MRSIFLLAGIGALALLTTIGVAQIEATPSTVVDFCPPQGPANCSTAATILVSSSKPSDATLIADINAIVAAARARHLSDAACRDTEAGLATLAAAIRDTAVANLAKALAISACGSGFQTATAGLSPAPFAGGTSGDGNSRPISSSSGSSSGSSGTNGNSSSGTSGASGTSGTSGTSSGDNGCEGDGCGSSSGSSGTNGNTSSGTTSSGASGNSSSGDQSSSGTGTSSGSTSGDQSSSGSGTSSGSTSGDQSSSGTGTSSGSTSSGASGNTSSGDQSSGGSGTSSGASSGSSGDQSSSGSGTSGGDSSSIPNGCEGAECGGGTPDPGT